MREKFTNRVHKHGGFLCIALYRDTVPLIEREGMGLTSTSCARYF